MLRRGAIESYYRKSDGSTSFGKPSAAVDEAAYILDLPQTECRTKYEDIIRAIEAAAAIQPIRESEALRDLLLSVAAPALAKFQQGCTTSDLQHLARGLLHERARLFHLTAEQAGLVISLRSNVLRVPGFPLTLRAVDDVVKVVN